MQATQICIATEACLRLLETELQAWDRDLADLIVFLNVHERRKRGDRRPAILQTEAASDCEASKLVVCFLTHLQAKDEAIRMLLGAKA